MSLLPKIAYPTFNRNLPSTGETAVIRQYLVKEEKFLLMLAEGKDIDEIIQGLYGLIGACVETETPIDAYSMLDVEYLFLQLRAVSVDSVINTAYKDDDDDKVREFKINIDDVGWGDAPNGKITIEGSEIGFSLRPPKFIDIIKGAAEADPNDEAGNYKRMVIKCIDKIWDKEGVWVPTDVPVSEVEEFVDTLDPKTWDVVRDFFDLQPSIEYTITYVNELGTERNITLRGLFDFFYWA